MLTAPLAPPSAGYGTQAPPYDGPAAPLPGQSPAPQGNSPHAPIIPRNTGGVPANAAGTVLMNRGNNVFVGNPGDRYPVMPTRQQMN